MHEQAQSRDPAKDMLWGLGGFILAAVLVAFAFLAWIEFLIGSWPVWAFLALAGAVAVAWLAGILVFARGTIGTLAALLRSPGKGS